MAKDSETLTLNLANNFLQAEESQTRQKEPAPKNIQTDDRQSSNEIIGILKYLKLKIAYLKKKQEVLQFANSPRLRKLPRFLNLSNNDMQSESLTLVHTTGIKNNPEKRSYINKGKSGKC